MIYVIRNKVEICTFISFGGSRKALCHAAQVNFRGKVVRISSLPLCMFPQPSSGHQASQKDLPIEPLAVP